MTTTVSDTTATVDVQCYSADEDGAVAGGDLVTTAAQDINSLTKGNFDFVVTPTGLAAGDLLDIRITVAITDGASGVPITADITDLKMLLDVQG